MGFSDMPASYDAWRTASPPERALVCPKCGKDFEEAEELDVHGLEGRGLLSYPLHIEHPDPKLREAGQVLYIGGNTNRARERARCVTVYRCGCGHVLTEDAFVDAVDFFGNDG